MGIKVRKDGNWIDLEVNNVVSPDGLTGSWTNTNKQHNTFYTNSTSALIYVSAIFRITKSSSEATSLIAGSNAWVYVSDPNHTGTNLSNYNQICRVRDNGTGNATDIFLNTTFFVPPSCKYFCKIFDKDLTNWGTDSRVSTLSWKEFSVQLKTPNNTTTSLDSNSNNFQRSGKAPSNGIANGWSQFMRDYAVWHEPGNPAVFGTTYSTTYTINITKAGNYTLEYGIDDNGTITFDGTQVASAVKVDETWKNNPPSFVTLSNVSIGSHTLVASIDNQTSTTSWTSNPAGIAWRLSPTI